MDLSLYKDESQIERKTPQLKRKSNATSQSSTPSKKSKRVQSKSSSSLTGKNKKKISENKRRNQNIDDGDDDKDDEDYSPSKKLVRSTRKSDARSTPKKIGTVGKSNNANNSGKISTETTPLSSRTSRALHRNSDATEQKSDDDKPLKSKMESEIKSAAISMPIKKSSIETVAIVKEKSQSEYNNNSN